MSLLNSKLPSNVLVFLFMCFVLFRAIILPPLSLSQGVSPSITSDGSLGTSVAINGPTYDITGGTRPGDGPNLFHSFGQFNVKTGEVANFLNASGLPTDNILSRVTGGDPSKIFGTIQTTDFGKANLFLLNPAGVIFGPTASLNVGGSFHVTTADFLRLGDDGMFHSELAKESVLTMAPPEAFGFLNGNPNGITIDRGGLEVPVGETLSVIGGDVEIIGPGFDGDDQLVAPSGRVNLASVRSAGEVVTHRPGEWATLNVDSFEHLGTIDINQGGEITVAGDPSGTVVIRGGKLILQSGYITASNRGPADHAGTAVDLQVRDSLVLRADGHSSSIGASSFGAGDAGDIRLTAETISFIGDPDSESFSFMSSTARGLSSDAGNGGTIEITGRHVLLKDGAVIEAPTLGPGTGGTIKIRADILELDATRHQAVIGGGSIGEQGGNAGDIDIKVTNSIFRGGSPFIGGLTTNVAVGPQSSAKAGNIQLKAENLQIFDGMRIQARIFAGSGKGGDIDIDAETIQISGRTGDGFSAGILTETRGAAEGNAGNIRINSQDMHITNFGLISAFSDSSGDSGNIQMKSDSLTVTNGGTIESTNFGSGHAGNITVEADTISLRGLIPEQHYGNGFLAIGGFFAKSAGNVTLRSKNLEVLDGSQIVTRTAGGGNAGMVGIVADNIVIGGTDPGSGSFDGIQAGIISSTRSFEPNPELATGQGGDVRIAASILDLRDQGLISVQSLSPGDGGSIKVDAGVVKLANRSSITADTTLTGNAGSVLINVNDLQMSNESEIRSRSSSGGTGDAGNITINAQTLTATGDGTLITTETNGSGKGGTFMGNFGELSVSDGARISSTSSGSGNAGGIVIRGLDGGDSSADKVLLVDGILTTSTSDTGRAGNIDVQSDTVTLANGANVSSDNSPTATGDAGTITLSGKEILLTKESTISTNTVTSGKGGAVNLEFKKVSLEDGSSIQSETSRSGAGGSVTVTAKILSLTGGGRISTNTDGVGPGGKITVKETDEVILNGVDSDGRTRSGLEATTTFKFVNAGDAGAIELKAKNMSITEGASITSSTTGPGKGGSIQITVDETVTLAGTRPDGIVGSGIRSEQFSGGSREGTGNAGNILVKAKNVTVTGGAEISSSTDGSGAGGSVTITAADAVTLAGASGNGSLQSGVRAEATGISTKLGKAGAVNVTANNIMITDEAEVSSRAVRIRSENEPDPANQQLAPAAGGNVSLEASQNIQLIGGASINAESTEQGNAGEIRLEAGESILLEKSTIKTEASQADGGNIKLSAPNLIHLIDSQITSSVGGGASTVGGNINLDPKFIVLNNTNILAQAGSGQGGQIELTATSIIQDSISIISASAGPAGIDGSVSVNDAVQFISESVVPLPEDLPQVARLYSSPCVAQKDGKVNSFVYQPVPSLPIQPGDFLNSHVAWADSPPSPLISGNALFRSVRLNGNEMPRIFNFPQSWFFSEGASALDRGC